MTDKSKQLDAARAKRSLDKRRAVERAIADLQESNTPLTFKAISDSAGVSRQYLYNNFKKQISELRDATRSGHQTVDGVRVPKRTPNEYRHTEALLRNKIERLKKDLKTVRRELATTKGQLERERGNNEHLRRLLELVRSEK